LTSRTRHGPLPSMLVTIGPEIVRRREAVGLSCRALAQRARVPRASLQRLESGSVSPRLAVLLRLADALRCDLTDLLDPSKPTR
jgi:transcriptional regulator with XRE-family HTH domain